MDSPGSATITGTIVDNGQVSSISSSLPPPNSEASLNGGSSNSSPSPSMAPNGSAEEQPSDTDALFPSSPTESPGAPSHGKHKHKSSRNKKDDSNTAGLIAGILILALIIVCVICLARRKKKKQPQKHPPHRYPQGGGKYPGQPMDYVVRFNQTPGGPWATPGRPPNGLNSSEFSEMGYQPSPLMMGGYGGRSQFSYEELEAATDGFSEANVLGQGGFGYVHKGVFPDGKIVAVKSLKAGSGQGEREFQAEVEIISRVHHRHLVSLVGYCIFSDKRMLVYEFVPNDTLEFHLHAKGQPVMNWATRMRIAIGAAKGLAYLHEDCHPRIIHRDIKSANILLDNNFEAKVADFGLAKLNVDNFTHVSTRVMGTFGYLAPEYAASGKLTEKSDVFSFGVMLVEIISGHRPVDPTNRTIEDSLVDWARPLMAKGLESGDYSELVDKRLGDNYVPQEMARMVSCANAGIRHSARRRPRMSQIVRSLDGGSLDDLNEKSKTTGPSSAATQSMHTDIYDTRAYNADMMKFRQMVLLDEDDSSILTDETTSGSSSKP